MSLFRQSYTHIACLGSGIKSILSRSVMLIFIGLAATTVTNATSFLVTKAWNTTDGVCDADCSFREALQAANVAGSDDTIDFAPGVFSVPQTIGFFGHAFIENNGTLAINGPGANLLTFDGQFSERILTIRNNATVTITGVTMMNGRGTASQ